MVYLRFSPIGHNVWAVMRCSEQTTFKCAEVVLRMDRSSCRLIPIASYALELDELLSITAFMREAHNEESAIVVPMVREKREAAHGRR